MAIPAPTVFKQYAFNTWFEQYGTVKDIKRMSATQLLIAGSFGRTNGDNDYMDFFACVHPDTGEIDYSYNSGGTGFNHHVHCMERDQWGSGKVLVGGQFTSYNGEPCGAIIRLNSDGSRDYTFDSTGTTLGRVQKIKIFSSQIYVMGNFTQLLGVSSNTVAKLDQYGTVNTTFATNVGSGATGSNACVYAMGWLNTGTGVVFGGLFDGWNGSARGNIAYVSDNGTLQATNSHFDSFIYDMDYPADASSLFVVGGFQNWTGSTGQVAQRGIAKINAGYTDLRLSAGYTGNTANNSAWKISRYASPYGYLFGTNATQYNGVDCSPLLALDINGNTTSTSFGDISTQIFAIEFNGNDVWLANVNKWDGVALDPALRVLKISNTQDAAPPLAATGLTASSIDFNSFKLSWTNNNVSGVTANTAQYFTTVWNDFEVLASGDTQVEYTGMTIDYSYAVRIATSGAGGTTYSTSIVVDTLDPKPTDLTEAGITGGSVTVWWNLPNPYGTHQLAQYKVATGSTWLTKESIGQYDTAYTYEDLDYNTTYDLRIVVVGSEYPSDSIEVTTDPYVALNAPNGLSAHTITYTGCSIIWDDNNPYDPLIAYRYEIYLNGSWVMYGYVSGGTEQGTFYNLLPQTQYQWRVGAQYNPSGGSPTYAYSTVSYVTTQAFPEPFCSGEYYGVIGSACGLHGSITIDEEYMIFYDFTLTDAEDDSWSMTGNVFDNLLASYYFITATPKSGWTYHYGSAPCEIRWISVPATDGNVTVDMIVRPHPQTFLRAAGTAGRIYADWTDTYTGITHSYALYMEDKTRVQLVIDQASLDGFLYENAETGTYYAMVVNQYLCVALSGSFQVNNQNSPFTLSGIKRIFVSEYKADLDWIQWATSDEDYYVASLDILKFQSAKIKTFTNANTWYSLPASMDTTFTQKMEKVRQGFVLSNVLTMTISPSAYSKWVATGTLLDKRWVVVFEDMNSNWWVFGYDGVGSQIRSYKRTSDLNYYALEFTSASSDKIITGIDYDDYVLPYIINS